MEKIPAACAMGWSIQLEKSLRSQKPGKSIEALEGIGRRLEWWNSESELTFAQYRMFGLIPGEDALFLNAIFLRLADAFRFGNKQIKNGVVKLFLRMKKRKTRDGKGILSKGKLENYLELLSRVKEVFDKGDVEERALTLVLFGCWAYFAKDCLDIRYIVLSSLVSDHVLEVKAALYAGGCMSELSDGFANVFLEILTTIVLSREISRGIKLAGGQAFAKMWYSFSLAENAYKTGLKLLMNSLEDDFSAVMLISLSRIASRWMLLIPTQIELLASFLNDERSLRMQATSLRCHRFILARGVGNFPSTADTVHKLFGILHRSELQPELQIEALRLLHKILLFNVSIMPCVEIPELFRKLLVVVKIMLQSSNVSTIVLAISILADLSEKALGRVYMVSGGTGPTLAFQVISFVLDKILSLVTPTGGTHHPDFVAELEIKRLLHILFNLVEKHTCLSCLVLHNICLFIDKLIKMPSKVMDPGKTGFSNNEVPEFGSHGKRLVESKLMPHVSKIVVSCLQNLEETDAETSQVLDSLKLQAENICHCSYFGSYTITIYFLILHLHSIFIYMRHTMEELMPLSKLSLSFFDSILQFDKYTLGCAKKMLGINSYWCSYKAGRSAACQGAWSTAAFIFEHLTTVVKSASCSCWINCLAQFSTSEKQIQFFLLPEQITSIITPESNIGERGGTALRTKYCSYIENLLRACTTLLSAEEILAASNTGHIFSFQQWFLMLRAKALKTIVDMMKLLDTISINQDNTAPGRQLERGILVPCTTSQTLGPLICSAMDVSYRMKKLAREFDLLLTSFMGMDRQSVMGVSALALSCSLMAFTAGFAFLVPNLHSSENFSLRSENSEESFHALLIEDLFGRLGRTDSETRKNLLVLLKSFRSYGDCFWPRFRMQNSYNSYEATVLHKLCEYSVGEIFSFQNEGTMVQQDCDAISRTLNNGSQLLLNIFSKLMLIPFRTPHHFFRVRPSVSSELFVMNEDGQIVDGSHVLSGSSLSLSLCLQLKNMPAALPGLLNKVYCILNCKAHSRIATEIGVFKDQVQLSKQDQEIDDMMDLNEKLLRYVTGSVETHALHSRGQANDSLVVNEYLCFELNERGQGFSTCLLNISSFPMGSYRIKWHSAFIDSEGSYWSLLPVNAGPLFTVHDAVTVQ
ncbi:hypothetical protein CDL12_01033 [Handroanthus impetiginosus]|uniref:Uncharacterized protein n=1 Tax=Handroanthus impetiginosus TaxID=429701 RepID=A0A2G9I8Y9_9LAMI|nr:hypothetical protein CDL12_01033 [Handroanthus impetiginosus]